MADGERYKFFKIFSLSSRYFPSLANPFSFLSLNGYNFLAASSSADGSFRIIFLIGC